MAYRVLLPLVLVASGCSVYDASLLDGLAQATGGTTAAHTVASGGASSGSTGGTSVGGANSMLDQQSTGGAATGGVDSTGGTASTGGTGTNSPCSETASTAVLADFETATAIVNPVEGRSGNWFSFNDGSGTQTPEKVGSTMPATASGTCQSTYSFQTGGSDFTGWGAGVGTDLVPKEGGIKQPYDLSKYSGFAFVARANAPLALRVSWSDGNTTEEGGVCNPDAQSGDPDRCGDYFGQEVILTTEWTRYEVRFSAMTQRGFGLSIPEGFDPTTAYGFRAQTSAGDFEFWLDELVFLP